MHAALHDTSLSFPQVVGQTYQQLDSISPRTYIGSGKALEVEDAVNGLDVDTVIFDDELTPGQLRNLEKAWGDEVRLCDRTALILDIFSQRAATREGQLQVGAHHLAEHAMHHWGGTPCAAKLCVNTVCESCGCSV